MTLEESDKYMANLKEGQVAIHTETVDAEITPLVIINPERFGLEFIEFEIKELK